MIRTIVEILLVEDNPDDAELTIRTLRNSNLGNHLLHLHDGQEALDFLQDEQNTPPKLILLDLKMPKVDGLDVLKIIKSDEKLKVIPVVLLTSSKEERDILQSYQLGVNSYIVKPVNLDQFIKAVTDVGLFWLVLNEPPPHV